MERLAQNMTWKLLEKAPHVGDVLRFWPDMICLVIRRHRPPPGKIPEVDVLWLYRDLRQQITTHYGGFDSWKGWEKLATSRRRIRTKEKED